MSIFDSGKRLTAEEERYAQMTLMEYLDKKLPNRQGYVTSYKAYRTKEEARKNLSRMHRNLVNRYQRQKKKYAYASARRAADPSITDTGRVRVKAGIYKVGDTLHRKTITGFGTHWRDASGETVCYAYLE